MGAIFSAIGSGINAIISAIANVFMAIVGAVTTIYSAADASVVVGLVVHMLQAMRTFPSHEKEVDHLICIQHSAVGEGVTERRGAADFRRKGNSTSHVTRWGGGQQTARHLLTTASSFFPIRTWGSGEVMMCTLPSERRKHYCNGDAKLVDIALGITFSKSDAIIVSQWDTIHLDRGRDEVTLE
ncbi:hypothetical protein EDD17DRAFT_1504804 [Pisolithus thermaeus]|nr:hypothetical protein EDD17DRAFT_1504804 [Pisolithus thermaeus]